MTFFIVLGVLTFVVLLIAAAVGFAMWASEGFKFPGTTRLQRVESTLQGIKLELEDLREPWLRTRGKVPLKLALDTLLERQKISIRYTNGSWEVVDDEPS
jgi:hypothetical protein